MPNDYSLFDYQVDGVNWLKSPRNNQYGFKCEPYVGLLGDEMGLGKTAQALDVVKDLINQGKRILFVVPGATIIQWQRNFDRWVLDCEPDEFGITSLAALRGSNSVIPAGMSCIISHSLLAKKDMIDKLIRADFDGMVIDEIHKFGAEGTKRIKHLWALMNLSPKHFKSCRIALSGTPVRNYAKEIINIAHFLGFPTDSVTGRFVKEDFYRKYLTYDGKALSRPQQFHNDFGPFYLRRTVAQVQKSLPSIRRTKLYTEITNPTLVKAYNRELDLLSNAMEHGGQIGTFSLLGYLVRLRHLTGIAKANEPAIIEPIVDYVLGENGKDTQRKVVIGIHHHLVASRIKNSELGKCKCSHGRMSHFTLDDDFKEHENPNCTKCSCTKYESEIPFFLIRGGMDDFEKEQIKADFINHKGAAVCLLSIKAAGEGIDGLQFAACKAYVFERQWNGADELQFEKRIHRTGQSLPVQIEYTIAAGTIDEFFDELVETKRQYTTQVEDENWETNPAFLRKLAEKVINSRLSVGTRDIAEFDQITRPKQDILETMEVGAWEV